MIPGRLLHRIAARIYCAKTLERVIEPAIADLQREYLDASNRGHAAITKLVANYLAVLWVISICTLQGSAAMDEERDNIRRMLLWACMATGVLTILLTLPPLSLYPEVRGWQAFLAVVPQALPLAIPVGLAFAFAVGPSAAPTARVYRVMLLTAFVASLLSFGVMAWGMPAGNQAFRELAFQAETRKAQRTGGGALENALRKGANEMTLSELRREIRNVANVDEQRRYSWTFH